MTSFSAALHKQGLLVRHGRPADEAQQGDAFAKTRPALKLRSRLGALAHPAGRHSSQRLPRDGAFDCTFLDRAVLIGRARVARSERQCTPPASNTARANRVTQRAEFSRMKEQEHGFVTSWPPSRARGGTGFAFF